MNTSGNLRLRFYDTELHFHGENEYISLVCEKDSQPHFYSFDKPQWVFSMSGEYFHKKYPDGYSHLETICKLPPWESIYILVKPIPINEIVSRRFDLFIRDDKGEKNKTLIDISYSEMVETLIENEVFWEKYLPYMPILSECHSEWRKLRTEYFE